MSKGETRDGLVHRAACSCPVKAMEISVYSSRGKRKGGHAVKQHSSCQRVKPIIGIPSIRSCTFKFVKGILSNFFRKWLMVGTAFHPPQPVLPLNVSQYYVVRNLCNFGYLMYLWHSCKKYEYLDEYYLVWYKTWSRHNNHLDYNFAMLSSLLYRIYI